jgi:hypothetical protein
MSPAPEGAIGATDVNPKGGGLDGALLAQEGCANEGCSFPSTVSPPDSSQGALLGAIINFFESLFGGGSSGPAIIPNGYHRVAHYPAMYFITDSQADIQQFTPHQKQKSDAIYILTNVLFVASIIIYAGGRRGCSGRRWCGRIRRGGWRKGAPRHLGAGDT